MAVPISVLKFRVSCIRMLAAIIVVCMYFRVSIKIFILSSMYFRVLIIFYFFV